MAPAKQEAPSAMALLDEYVDRRAALTRRRFELEEQLPRLRQAWNEAAATADPTDDLPAQRAYEQAEREFKNVEVALVGIEQKIENVRNEIAVARHAAMRAQACREAQSMEADAEAMEDSFGTFMQHLRRFIASHNQCRQLIRSADQLTGFAYWVERQLIEAGLPDLSFMRTQTSFSGAGSSPSEVADTLAALAETN